MRLIDLDTLKQNLCGECAMNFPKECRQIGCAKVDKQDILEALRIPIIDAVPVIRCKECLYKPHCESYRITQQEDAYCSLAVRAERKEECSR